MENNDIPSQITKIFESVVYLRVKDTHDCVYLWIRFVLNSSLGGSSEINIILGNQLKDEFEETQ
jgi:hypothetical protein